MHNKEYLIKNACYSVTKYYLCKQNNKRSLLGRKQRSQVVRSFPNRYQFSCTNKVTSLFSDRYIFIIILQCYFGRMTLHIRVEKPPFRGWGTIGGLESRKREVLPHFPCSCKDNTFFLRMQIEKEICLHFLIPSAQGLRCICRECRYPWRSRHPAE